MYNRTFFQKVFYYPLMNCKITGKQYLASQECFRNQYNREIAIQEAALDIFNSLEEYRQRENVTTVKFDVHGKKDDKCEIEEFQTLFYDIAYSNPAEGVFENISRYQLVRFLSSERSQFNSDATSAEKINNFCLKYKREIVLSWAISTLQAKSILYEIANIQKYLFSAANQLSTSIANKIAGNDIIRTLSHEVEQISEICNIILGDQDVYSGGYSKLSDEQKHHYNQLSKQLKKWEELFNTLSSLNVVEDATGAKCCQNLIQVLSVANDCGAILNPNVTQILNDLPYSARELEKYMFPRPINTTKVKLHNERFVVDNSDWLDQGIKSMKL